VVDSNNMSKRAYAQPKLSVYGGFSQLTAAGSLGLNEGPGNGNSGFDRMA
jgi:hypothetical protein